MTHDWKNPDIAIVGSGPAGQYLATALSKSGARITMFEEGLWPLRHQHRSDHVGSVVLDTHEGPVRHQVAIGYGGTSRLWSVRVGNGERGIRIAALLPGDLVRPGRAEESNWPISHEELAPHLHAALHKMQPGLSIAPDQDPFQGPDLGAFAMPGTSSRYYYFGSVEPFQDRDRFLAANPNIVLRYGTRVADIVAGEPTSLRCLDRTDGTETVVRAGTVVLACGGLESVRILLASPSVAEDSATLGRYYMDRARYLGERLVPGPGTDLSSFLQQLEMRPPTWRMAHLQVEPQGAGARVSLTPFPVDDHAPWRTKVQNLVGLVDSYGQQIPGRLAKLGAASETIRHANLKVLDAMARLAGNAHDTNWDHVSRPAARRPDALQLRGTIEQVADPDNRLSLSSATDVFGLPGLDVRAQMRHGEVDAARAATARYAAHLESHGFRSSPSEWRVESYTSHHHMGGARMGRDPQTSVVDPHLEVHNAPGVFVLSSAVFPSSGYANPTFTTQALALRLAAKLAAS